MLDIVNTFITPDVLWSNVWKPITLGSRYEGTKKCGMYLNGITYIRLVFLCIALRKTFLSQGYIFTCLRCFNSFCQAHILISSKQIRFGKSCTNGIFHGFLWLRENHFFLVGCFYVNFTKLSYPRLTTINLISDFKTYFQNNKMLAWTSHIKLGPLGEKQLLVLSDILWGSMKATDLSNLRIK